ncbi:MAG: putative bifunctional diguanylate cyclase/phosphodiesterase [Microthrixaceae bacterium]
MARDLMDGLFERAPVAMVLVDDHGAVAHTNAAMRQLAKDGACELVGRPLAAVLPGFAGPGSTVPRPAGSSAPSRRLVRVDGTEVWVVVLEPGVSVPDEDGRPCTVLQLLDVSERRDYERRLAELSETDPLTGVANRGTFLRALGRHDQRLGDDPAAEGDRGGVLVIDLDHFKRINDLHGDAVGDQVIASVAGALAQRIGPDDVVGRMGGDCFAVLATNGGPDELRALAGHLVEAVRHHLLDVDGHRVPLTASVGLASFDGAERSVEDWLMDADLAMYDAMELGGDRWAEHLPGRTGRTLRSHVDWIGRVEEALDHDGFVLEAQPVRSFRTGEVVQWELLLRMVDHDGTLIPPLDFLPAAERFGLIPRIDRWVMSRALDLLEVRLPPDAPTPVLAVNVSGPGMSDRSMLDLVEERVAAGRIDPTRLVVEVTETAAVTNMADARTFAFRLRGLGARLALDDFGAGFGSFYYLKYLPFDDIKIDGEFVRGCLDDDTDQAVLRSIVGLARRLGKRTVAEHVPNDAVAAYLQVLGVDMGQGFHLGRPQDLAVAGLLAPGPAVRVPSGEVPASVAGIAAATGD